MKSFAGFVLAAAIAAAPLGGQAAPSDSLPRLVVQAGHEKLVSSLAFSPDGRLVLSGSFDASARLWGAASGREIRAFDCSDEHESVFGAEFTHDGRYALVACADRKVHLFDLATGEDVRQFEGEGSYLVRSLAVTPDGQGVLVGGSETGVLYEVATGRRLGAFNAPEEILAAAFSPDGSTLLTTGLDPQAQAPSRNVRLWSTSSREITRTFETAPTEQPQSLAWSPDADRFVTGTMEGGLQLWDSRTGAAVWEEPEAGAVTAVAFSPDGRFVVSGMVGGSEPSDPERPVRAVNTRAFTGARTVAVWDATTGAEVRVLDGHSGPVAAVAVSPDGRHVVAGGNDGTAHMWDIDSGRRVRSLTRYGNWVEFARLGPNAEYLLTGNEDRTAHLWDLTAGRLVHTRSFPGVTDHDATFFPALDRWDDVLGFTPEGGQVLVRDDGAADRVWNPRTGRLGAREEADDPESGSRPAGERYTLSFDDGLYAPAVLDRETGRKVPLAGSKGQLTSHAFSPNGRHLLAASWDAYLWDTETGQLVRTLSGGPETGGIQGIEDAAFSPDGRYALTSNGDFSVGFWDLSSGRILRTLRGHSQAVVSVSFSGDQARIVTGSLDGSTRLWEAETGREIAALYAFSDGTWVVTEPGGRFDTSDLETIEGIHWVMPDDPLTPVPIEAFMRDYYEPRLLPRLLASEEFPEIRELLERNRVQPEVGIEGVELNPDGTATVAVRVASVRRELGGQPRASEVHDVRLFRNGQLVAWEEGAVAIGKDSVTLRFDGIALPAADSVTFSAYAFNDDRVKSRTDYHAAAVPDRPVRERRAYVISLGVDRFDEPAWNLGFAANDARQFQRVLPPLLEGSGQFDEVVSVQLVSALDDDPGIGDARKETVRSVLALLAGEEVPAAVRARIPNAHRLRRATPDDLILVTVSTHGYTDDAGVFYLLPEDIPASGGKRITPELLRAAVSSDELSLWLRGVDAGELVMIVDACHAAAAVEGTDFKPGPMGSRGLGQLAFDKSMRILTATQSADVAWENSRLRQGLLSFALIENGLEARQADQEPRDGAITLSEWLAYGVSRVPELHGEVIAGSVQTFGRGNPDPDEDEDVDDPLFDLGLDTMRRSRPQLQTPSLFDFTRERPAIVLIGASGGSENE